MVMPSLLSTYNSAPKTRKGNAETKGDILLQLQVALKLSYVTVRNKLVGESFSYAEKVVISQTRNKPLDELFPEEVLQIN